MNPPDQRRIARLGLSQELRGPLESGSRLAQQIYRATTVLLLGLGLISVSVQAQSGTNGTPSAQQNKQSSTTTQNGPHFHKLVLKDGNVQPIREYEIRGDRVRYYSLDASEWDEIPASLVDWDATKKLAADEAAHNAELNSKIHLQEAGRLAQPLDIDASLEAAPGIFLPPGEGLFIFDGKTVSPMEEAEIGTKLNKKQEVKKILVPIPVIPSRHTISIQGAHATLRVRLGQTEFYMRTTSTKEPELDLVRTKVHGNSREIANVDELFGQQAASANRLLFQRWEIAKGVYRFTIGQAIDPGEYALIEVLGEGGMSIYVWDFGVDPLTSDPKTRPR